MGSVERSASRVGPRALALAVVVACGGQDAAPSQQRVASAQPVTVGASPWGASARWERDAYRPGQHLCFEVRGDRFQVSVWPEGSRHPALIRGRYEAAQARGSDASVSVLTLHTETITTRSLTRCRRSWEDADIPFALALGTRFEVGSTVRLGATLMAGDRLRLCRARTCGDLLAVASRDLPE